MTRTIIDEIESELCINTNQRFVTGGSNGGMLTHWVSNNLPTFFLGALPIYGLPLIGYNRVTDDLKGTSILSFHDR